MCAWRSTHATRHGTSSARRGRPKHPQQPPNRRSRRTQRPRARAGLLAPHELLVDVEVIFLLAIHFPARHRAKQLMQRPASSGPCGSAAAMQPASSAHSLRGRSSPEEDARQPCVRHVRLAQAGLARAVAPCDNQHGRVTHARLPEAACACRACQMLAWQHTALQARMPRRRARRPSAAPELRCRLPAAARAGLGPRAWANMKPRKVTVSSWRTPLM